MIILKAVFVMVVIGIVIYVAFRRPGARQIWIIFGTLFLMVVSGIVTFAVTTTYWMNLGIKRHDNYEYYAYYAWYAPALVWGPAVIGFLFPEVVAWVLHKIGTSKGVSEPPAPNLPQGGPTDTQTSPPPLEDGADETPAEEPPPP